MLCHHFARLVRRIMGLPYHQPPKRALTQKTCRRDAAEVLHLVALGQGGVGGGSKASLVWRRTVRQCGEMAANHVLSERRFAFLPGDECLARQSRSYLRDGRHTAHYGPGQHVRHTTCCAVLSTEAGSDMLVQQWCKLADCLNAWEPFAHFFWPLFDCTIPLNVLLKQEHFPISTLACMLCALQR